MDDVLKLERVVFVNASLERVWEALVDPKLTKKYMFGCEVNSNWKEGSEIKWRGNFMGYKVYIKGTILECRPLEYVRYSSFDPSLGYEDIPENYLYVSYKLIEKDGGTEVTFLSENFGNDEKRYKEGVKAWDKMVIPGFKKIFK